MSFPGLHSKDEDRRRLDAHFCFKLISAKWKKNKF